MALELSVVSSIFNLIKQWVATTKLDLKFLIMQRNGGLVVQWLSLFPIGWMPFFHGFFVFTQPWRHGEKCAKRVLNFIWAFPEISPLSSKCCPQGQHYNLGISEWISNTHLALAKRSPTCGYINGPFYHFPQSMFLTFIFIKNQRWNRKI
jgi:hypothetical protein